MISDMKKILIAEDNDSNYILMTYILKKYYEYERAKNGKEAVEMVEKNDDYAIVLMDIKMPVMDGLEATKAIKEIRPDLPVIALTANAFDSDRQLAIEAGCDDFLAKPVSSDLCLMSIKKFIGE
jgi:CheY-like chemotaxis protein